MDVRSPIRFPSQDAPVRFAPSEPVSQIQAAPAALYALEIFKGHIRILPIFPFNVLNTHR